jgi:hypothetical protein
MAITFTFLTELRTILIEEILKANGDFRENFFENAYSKYSNDLHQKSHWKFHIELSCYHSILINLYGIFFIKIHISPPFFFVVV